MALALSTAADWIDLDEGVELLAPTGRPVSRKALANLLTREKVRTEKIAGRLYASASDVLKAHRDLVAREQHR